MKLKQTFTLLLCLAMTAAWGIKAQVTIGSSEVPVTGALLELKQANSTTKGLGMPRVELTDLEPTSPAGLSASIGNTGNWDLDEHIGLCVYNVKGDICIPQGLYVWSGARWTPLQDNENAYGNHEGDVAALIAIYNSNPGNTLGWDIISGDPLTFAGVTWALVCGEMRVIELDVASKNLTTTLDVKDLACLEDLRCNYNSLSALDVSKNTRLKLLHFYANRIASLDVSKSTQLRYLIGFTNQLTTLDLSNNTVLTELQCYNNSLQTLNISKNTQLITLMCSGNSLTALDVSNNTQLGWLYCGNNNLTNLDVSNNTLLRVLSCFTNTLTTLDISNNTQLTELQCHGNMLTTLDVSNNTQLTILNCIFNKLTVLDISNNPLLTDLNCYYNQLTQTEVNKLKDNHPNYCGISTRSVVPQYAVGTTTADYSVTAPACP